MTPNFEAIILAGGQSSRFGRFKQIERITKSGKTLIELNLKNLVECGIRKIVVVTNEQLKTTFHSLFAQYAQYTKIEVVIQLTEQLPQDTEPPVKRLRPWGVAHALWVGAQMCQNTFIMMNADDYYTSGTLQSLCQALEKDPSCHYMVAYDLQKTLFEGCRNVNRGICYKKEETNITSIEVASSISFSGNKIEGTLHGKERRFSGTEITCMNLYGFNNSIISHLENHVKSEAGKMKDDQQEIMVHEMLNNLLERNLICLKMVPVNEACLGLTNTEDIDRLQKHLAETYGI